LKPSVWIILIPVSFLSSQVKTRPSGTSGSHRIVDLVFKVGSSTSTICGRQEKQELLTVIAFAGIPEWQTQHRNAADEGHSAFGIALGPVISPPSPTVRPSFTEPPC
jgi:hypothetical protein